MKNKDYNFYSVLEGKKASRLQKYQDIVVGNRSLKSFLKQEIFTFLFGLLPGVPGLAVRQFLYPFIFSEMGKKTTIGTGVTLKQPGKISISSACIIDDYVHLSVRGSQDSKIEIQNNTFVGRGTEIKVREGSIVIGNSSSIGSYCRISIFDGKIRIGQHGLIAAYCYIGAGNHKTDRLDIPMIMQPFDSKGGVTIEDDVWIGANTTIADGVTIGRGSIIGAHSYVNTDIPAYSIVFGCPAKIHRKRKTATIA